MQTKLVFKWPIYLHFLFLQGDYGAEKCPVMKQRSPPSYSFGSRTALGKKDNFPSPSSYTLPAVLGSKAVGKASAASYSITGRSKIGSFHEDLQKVGLFYLLPNHSELQTHGSPQHFSSSW